MVLGRNVGSEDKSPTTCIQEGGSYTSEGECAEGGRD